MSQKQTLNQPYIAQSETNNNADSQVCMPLENEVKTLCELKPELDSISNTSSIHLNTIGENLLKIQSTISSSNWDAVLIACIGAVAGAVAGFVFNWLYSIATRKRDNLSKLVDALHSHICELETVAVAYWLRSYNDSVSVELVAEEIKIKASLRVLRYLSQNFLEHVNKDKNSELEKEINKFSHDIYDVITGDEFETKNLEPSKEKAQKISVECVMIRAKILSFLYSF